MMDTGHSAPLQPIPADEAKVRKVEIAISTLLRVGVVSSLAIVVLGTILSFANHPQYLSSHDELGRITGPSAEFPHTLPDVARQAIKLQGRAIIMVGLILLVLTPVARVAISILAFIYQRDWTFVVITAFVLAMLLLSFAMGRVE